MYEYYVRLPESIIHTDWNTDKHKRIFWKISWFEADTLNCVISWIQDGNFRRLFSTMNQYLNNAIATSNTILFISCKRDTSLAPMRKIHNLMFRLRPGSIAKSI